MSSRTPQVTPTALLLTAFTGSTAELAAAIATAPKTVVWQACWEALQNRKYQAAYKPLMNAAPQFQYQPKLTKITGDMSVDAEALLDHAHWLNNVGGHYRRQLDVLDDETGQTLILPVNPSKLQALQKAQRAYLEALQDFLTSPRVEAFFLWARVFEDAAIDALRQDVYPVEFLDEILVCDRFECLFPLDTATRVAVNDSRRRLART